MELFLHLPVLVIQCEVEEEILADETIQPGEFRLLGNYPNPFNPSTTIRFSVPSQLNKVVKIKIYNSIGEFVKITNIVCN